MSDESKLEEIKLTKARIPLKTVFSTTPAERKKYVKNVRSYNIGLIANRKAKLEALAKQKAYAENIQSAIKDYESSEAKERAAFLQSLKDFESKSGTTTKVVDSNYGGMSKGTGAETLSYLKSRLKVSKPTSSSSSRSSRSSRSRSSGKSSSFVGPTKSSSSSFISRPTSSSYSPLSKFKPSTSSALSRYKSKRKKISSKTKSSIFK